MNRTEVIVGSLIAVLAVAGIGQIYHDRGALKEFAHPKAAVDVIAMPPEVKPVTIEELVSGFMTSLEQGSDEQKAVALTSLLDELGNPPYNKGRLSDETIDALSQGAMAIVGVSTTTEGPEAVALRLRAVDTILTRGTRQSGKRFVFDMAKARGLESDDVVTAIQKLSEGGLIARETVPGAMKRLAGKKAQEPILALMRDSDHWKTIAASVVALQEYQDPALLAPSFERLEQAGLINKAEMLPWINAKLYGQFMQTAEGSALTRGLRAAKTRPSLVKAAMDAVKRGLEQGDPETRRVCAEAVRKAVIGKVVSAKEGESLLSGRLDRETEPVLKAELTGGIEQMRRLLVQEEQAIQ